MLHVSDKVEVDVTAVGKLQEQERHPELPGRLALYVQKKDLSCAQNLENKGPEIFLPPRSMVLKVVRGKIFKTWKLRSFSAA